MTLLSSTSAPTPGPGPARRPRPSPLLRAVRAAIVLFDDAPAAATNARRIDGALRHALARHLEHVGEDAVPGVPAVRVACAHLTAGDLEDAYLALLTARDLLR